uniref:Uncharacterized protein n=1 Tax=Anguilla anguilla TaxID=7936 RepID=A0A0E9VV33_ANGAN
MLWAYCFISYLKLQSRRFQFRLFGGTNGERR